MDILSHTKSGVCGREWSWLRWCSHDGELDPFLIYRHGRNVDIFRGPNMCAICQVLCVVCLSLINWASLPLKVWSQIDMPLLLRNELNIARGKSYKCSILTFLWANVRNPLSHPHPHVHTNTRSGKQTRPPPTPGVNLRLLQDVGGCQCWWIPTFDCDAARVPGEKPRTHATFLIRIRQTNTQMRTVRRCARLYDKPSLA